MKKLIGLLTLVTLGMPAYGYDGWSLGRVLAVRTQGTRILVNQANATNPGSCADTTYLSLPLSDSILFKSMYAALLTAYAGQTPVSFALTGCADGYPVIEQIYLQ